MTLKVQLKPNVRIYEADDSDFEITGKEIKELPARHLRSYSIKYYLFHGLIEVVEGDLTFHMKSAIVYVAANQLYAHEFGNYFTKDLELDTITFIAEEAVPKNILVKINPKASVQQETIKEIIPEAIPDEIIPEANTCSTDNAENITEEIAENNFDIMTKTELKQYAKENNISFDKNIKVGELRELLK